MSKIVIAIDGPAGAGKSTVAKILAQRLGLHYLDTGAMYRCLALAATRGGLGPDDGEKAALIPIEISFGDGDPQPVFLNGEDVTALIRTPEIAELASALSAHSAVRAVLATRQKEIVAAGGYTLEGRDTTTVVAPNATLKVFLTASLEERTRRRLEELEAKGVHHEANDLARQISERDHRDRTRDDSPLTQAPDAVLVETFGLTPIQVADAIEAALKQKLA